MEDTVIYDLIIGQESDFAYIVSDYFATQFGLNRTLVAKIRSKAIATTPLNRLVFSQVDESDNLSEHEGEGRGTYHEDGEGNIIYVKGTGSLALVNEKHHGFPAEESSLLHEYSPRVKGASDMTENFIDFVNASLIFAHTARANSWKSIQTAMNAGVSIPLNVTYFPEESQRIKEIWRSSSERKYKYPKVTWSELNGIGSISMIVPSKTRLSNHLYFDYANDIPNDENVLNAEFVGVAARGIRHLLEIGMYYYEDGFHAQNFFDRGVVPQADNAEIGFISRIIERGDEYRLAFIAYISNQLGDINKPGIFEVKSGNFDFEDYVIYIRTFISNLQGILIDDQSAEYFTVLATLDRRLLHDCLSNLLITQFESEEWHYNAAMQEACLDLVPSALKRVAEKDDEMAKKIITSSDYRIDFQNIERASTLGLMIFYGNPVQSDQYISNLLQLAYEIQEISDIDIKNIFCAASKKTISVFKRLGLENTDNFHELISLIRQKNLEGIRNIIRSKIRSFT